ncbi:MAG: hypothetical protein J1E37_05620 [Prevotella sp.]|nr:hypothetical protein [Prevotella sp.]
MAKYSTEIREVFDNKYIKVFLAEHNDLSDVRTVLGELQCVRKVNISNGNNDLTVYVKPPFSAQEAKATIDTTLCVYYNSPHISQSTIQDIIAIRDTLPPKSKGIKCYNDAICKIIEGKYDRNVIDDIRLALELYLKETLKNDKPLEKQTTSLKEFYKQKKLSGELINIHTQSLHNLCDFFNNHTKHDYNVKHEEVDSVIGYATQIMNSLIDVK